MSNLIGQSLGRYHILEQLGEGGMAIVYKAYDTRLERDVAVKVIRTEKLTIETMGKTLKRFEREAKALAKLTHPNIVPITDYGEHDGKPYLVMPYLPGGTLKQKLGKPIPWEDAVRLLIPIARALHYAHQQGIIHRDIKPSNILITQSGEPMLTDFGIAKILLDTEETADLTGTGMGVGTPEYMSPEQFQGKGVDARTDVYSLGVVLYEMITGRKPYQADTPAAVLIKQVTEALPRPKSFVPDLPDAMEKMLLKALAKNKEDRFQDVAAFGDGLENLLMGTSKSRKSTAMPTMSKPVELDFDTQETVLQKDTHAIDTQNIDRVESHPKLPVIVRKTNWKFLVWWVLVNILNLTAIIMVEKTTRFNFNSSSYTWGLFRLPYIVSINGYLVISADVLIVLLVSTLEYFILCRYIKRTFWWILTNNWILLFVAWKQRGLISVMLPGSTKHGFYVTDLGNKTIDAFIIALVFIIIIMGIIQWLVLRGQSHSAGWWIPLSILEWFCYLTVWNNIIFISNSSVAIDGIEYPKVSMSKLSNWEIFFVILAVGIIIGWVLEKILFHSMKSSANEENDSQLTLQKGAGKGGIWYRSASFSNYWIGGLVILLFVTEAITYMERQLFVARINTESQLIFGPQSGILEYQDDGNVSSNASFVDLNDFAVEGIFKNPYKGVWDYGFLFRQEGGNKQYRLVINSYEFINFGAGWQLINSTGGGNSVIIDSGEIQNLDTSEGGSNKIRLICQGNRGLLYVNEILIDELDLSARKNSGDVLIATGVYSHQINVYSTEYKDFTVWKTP